MIHSTPHRDKSRKRLYAHHDAGQCTRPFDQVEIMGNTSPMVHLSGWT